MTDDTSADSTAGEPDGAGSGAALRALFDSARDALIVADDRARIVDANAAAAALRGEPREALIGRTIADLTAPDLRARGRERWEELMREGSRIDTTRLVRADGSEIEVEYAATANFMPGRHLWAVRDVTDRNRAVRQARFQADLLDHVEAAVVAVTPAGRVTHWNAAAERLYGVPRDEAAGRIVAELVVAAGEERTAAEVWATVRDGRTWEGEFSVRRRHGEPVTAWVLAAPIPSADGGVGGYVGVAVDMTARLRAARQLERSNALRQAILQSALDAVVAMDGDGRTVEWNAAAESIFGYSRDEAIGRDLVELICPPDLAGAVREQVARYREHGYAWPLNQRVEARARRADGSELPIELSVTDVQIGDESPVFTAYIRDITARRQAGALLARRAQQQQAVAELGQRALRGRDLAELMEDAVATVARTLGTEIVALLELVEEHDELLVRAATGTPPEFASITRIPLEPGDSVSHALATREPVVVDDWSAESRFEMHVALRARGIASLVDVVVDRGEQDAWGVLTAQSTETHRFTQDDVTFMQAVANVLAGTIERQRVEDAIRHLALHDSLTGLPNRALFIDRLEHALAQVERRGKTLAVIFLDIDQFKVVNDSLGHQQGDRLLQAIAPRLEETLRPGDTLARFAGDEFVVLCEGLDDEQGAIAVAQRLTDCFAEPFQLGAREQFVSASMGIALPRRSTETAEQLIRDADAAMYRAKERGRARFELFDERMRVRTLLRMRIENDLRRARPPELHVHYQPIVSIAQGDLAGFEALMRWRHPRRGDVPPSEFIPVAEDSGLIQALGRWVLQEAAEQAVRWRGRAGARAEALGVSVNLSARQFTHGGLADEVAGVLGATGLEPERLLLEITESVLMEETSAAVEALHALKALGVRLVLDDFGTGFSSLSYLERFPIDALKIDRSFVAGLDAGGSGAIVAAIVSMAHSLDLRVTAEGVETEEQLEHLRRLGCEYAQGYFFGRPAAADAHDRLLVARPNAD